MVADVPGRFPLDVGLVQHAHGPERAQCLDHDDVAALHVGHALAAHAVALALPQRHRAAFFEHRVQVAEQQQAFALTALQRRHQVARTLHGRRHVDPAGVEAQRVQLRPVDVADGAHAFRVQGAAVDAHRFLQQIQRRGRALLDGGDDALFGLGELRMRRTGQQEGGGDGGGEFLEWHQAISQLQWRRILHRRWRSFRRLRGGQQHALPRPLATAVGDWRSESAFRRKEQDRPQGGA